MEAYAVIETGGKQYMVKPNDQFKVEKLDAAEGATVILDRVLALSNGEALQVGAPVVEGAQVAVTVVQHVRGPKVINFKKKRRKGYERKIGHRQDLTVIKVATIQ